MSFLEEKLSTEAAVPEIELESETEKINSNVGQNESQVEENQNQIIFLWNLLSKIVCVFDMKLILAFLKINKMTTNKIDIEEMSESQKEVEFDLEHMTVEIKEDIEVKELIESDKIYNKDNEIGNIPKTDEKIFQVENEEFFDNLVNEAIVESAASYVFLSFRRIINPLYSFLAHQFLKSFENISRWFYHVFCDAFCGFCSRLKKVCTPIVMILCCFFVLLA